MTHRKKKKVLLLKYGRCWIQCYHTPTPSIVSAIGIPWLGALGNNLSGPVGNVVCTLPFFVMPSTICLPLPPFPFAILPFVYAVWINARDPLQSNIIHTRTIFRANRRLPNGKRTIITQSSLNRLCVLRVYIKTVKPSSGQDLPA